MERGRLKDAVGPGPRFPFGLGSTDNANSLWIQLSTLRLEAGEDGTSGGRDGLVMVNSTSDAPVCEKEIRCKLN